MRRFEKLEGLRLLPRIHKPARNLYEHHRNIILLLPVISSNVRFDGQEHSRFSFPSLCPLNEFRVWNLCNDDRLDAPMLRVRYA